MFIILIRQRIFNTSRFLLLPYLVKANNEMPFSPRVSVLDSCTESHKIESWWAGFSLLLAILSMLQIIINLIKIRPAVLE
jgi:hypothetical protein